MTDPSPLHKKTWNVAYSQYSSTPVEAFTIEYTYTHVVFKSLQGVTIKAFRAEDVISITLMP